MNNYNYYNKDGVKISTSELIIKDKSYPLSVIISFRIAETNTHPKYGVLLMFTGGLLLLDEGSLFILGGCLFFIGVLLSFTMNASYSLHLITPEGDKTVIVSKYMMEIDSVMIALDQAISDYKKQVEISRLSSA